MTEALRLKGEQTEYARGSTFNGLLEILRSAGVTLDKGGSGKAYVLFSLLPLADDTLTINGVVFKFAPTGGVYDVAVPLGVSITLTIDNLVSAINNFAAVAVNAKKGLGGTVCMLQSTSVGTTSNFPLAESTVGVRMVISGAAAVGGKAKQDIVALHFGQYTVTAGDVVTFTGPDEVPVTVVPSTNQPGIIMLGAVDASGAVRPLTANIIPIWRQFKTGFWTLCLQDIGPVLVAGDIISVISVG